MFGTHEISIFAVFAHSGDFVVVLLILIKKFNKQSVRIKTNCEYFKTGESTPKTSIPLILDNGTCGLNHLP
jgi:hypothetical protein